MSTSGALASRRTPSHARVSAGTPLFSVGISGGFVGATMTATVHASGTVMVVRQGGGRVLHTSRYTVPLTVSSVRQVNRIARMTHVFAIPEALQMKAFGADIPIRSFTIYTASGARTVRAYGSESGHVIGVGRFFPVWGLFYALAGYPTHIG